MDGSQRPSGKFSAAKSTLKPDAGTRLRVSEERVRVAGPGLGEAGNVRFESGKKLSARPRLLEAAPLREFNFKV